MKQKVKDFFRNPLVKDGLISAPISGAITAYMLVGGAGWLWAIYGGVLGVLVASGVQGWENYRTAKAVTKQLEGQYDSKRLGEMTALAASNRREIEAWQGWDWRDYVGIAIGAQVGSIIAVVIL